MDLSHTAEASMNDGKEPELCTLHVGAQDDEIRQ